MIKIPLVLIKATAEEFAAEGYTLDAIDATESFITLRFHETVEKEETTDAGN